MDVHGIGTKGHFSESTWVTRYTIYISDDGVNWTPLLNTRTRLPRVGMISSLYNSIYQNNIPVQRDNVGLAPSWVSAWSCRRPWWRFRRPFALQAASAVAALRCQRDVIAFPLLYNCIPVISINILIIWFKIASRIYLHQNWPAWVNKLYYYSINIDLWILLA